MPHEWEKTLGEAPDTSSGASSYAAGDAPLAVLHLWPYRSLPRKGFAIFIGLTFMFILFPLFAVMGTMILWGLLPFTIGALALMWVMLERSYKDGSILEELRIWSDKIELSRHNPRGPDQHWDANPYWVNVILHKKGGPVENYLTLKGNGREVEIGAFLTPEEREILADELRTVLARLPKHI